MDQNNNSKMTRYYRVLRAPWTQKVDGEAMGRP